MEYVYQMNPGISIARPSTKLAPKIVSWMHKWKNAHCKYFCDFNIVTNVHGEGNGNPLQYSCLETPMDGGTC